MQIKFKTPNLHVKAYPRSPEPFKASQPGALDGNASECSACPFVGATSLSGREAVRLTEAHIDWMMKEGR